MSEKQKESEKEPEPFALTSCRFYESELPKENDLVIMIPYEINDVGVKIRLPEYNHIEAFMMLSECSRRRVRSVKQLVRLNEIDVACVLRVDPVKQYIDVSKKHVAPSEKGDVITSYLNAKKVDSIVKQTCYQLNKNSPPTDPPEASTSTSTSASASASTSTSASASASASASTSTSTSASASASASVSLQPQQIYEDFIWPNYDSDEIYELFVGIVAGDSEAMDQIPPKYSQVMIDIIKKSIVRIKYNIHQRLQINCYSSHGVEGIIKSIQAGLDYHQSQAQQVSGTIKIQSYKNKNEDDIGFQLSGETYDSESLLEHIKEIYQKIRDKLTEYSEAEDQSDITFEAIQTPTISTTTF